MFNTCVKAVDGLGKVACYSVDLSHYHSFTKVSLVINTSLYAGKALFSTASVHRIYSIFTSFRLYFSLFSTPLTTTPTTYINTYLINKGLLI